MRAVVSRVKAAKICIAGKETAIIGRGVLVYLGFCKSDDEMLLKKMAQKIINLRVFEDDRAKMSLSVKDMDLEILCVPNFTLGADINNGNRPSFDPVMDPKRAREFYDSFIQEISLSGLKVLTGVFGADMDISSENAGPVNIVIDIK
ncbi:MAG: D-aminoacyl-tRNA deacylase [Candidatus Omnitrophica bacterium]|nr:D-aminoacyl-tRNA deacylase [Candidatus Omnitrophota bacterium]